MKQETHMQRILYLRELRYQSESHAIHLELKYLENVANKF